MDRAFGRFVQTLGHVFGRMSGDGRLTRFRRRDGDEARSRPHGALCAQDRGAGLAARPRDHEHAAEVALVRVRRARLDQRTHLLAGQQFEARTLELIDHSRRECRCRRSRPRRRAFRRAAGPAAASARASVTVIAASMHSPIRSQVSALHAARQIDRDDRHAGRVHVGDDGLEHAGSGAFSPVPKIASTISSCTGDLGEVQLPRLLVGDLDDGSAEPAEDFEVEARIALDSVSGR